MYDEYCTMIYKAKVQLHSFLMEDTNFEYKISSNIKSQRYFEGQ